MSDIVIVVSSTDNGSIRDPVLVGVQKEFGPAPTFRTFRMSGAPPPTAQLFRVSRHSCPPSLTIFRTL